MSQILTEHFVNLTTPEQKKHYAKTVWDILQFSYKDIGGFRSASSPEELIHDSHLWKLARRNGKIVAVSVFKDSHGRKAIAYGSDGSDAGRRDLRQMAKDDVGFGRMWGEASGAVEHIYNKLGAKPIPAKYASFLTGKEILEYNPDGYHYTRRIMGHPHEKILFGFVNISPEMVAKAEKMGLDLHDLPTKKG
jgi:hypothetical protein